MNHFRTQFFGGAGTVTGSLFLVETANKKILVDCGLYQGEQIDKEKNDDAFPFSPSDIDALVVTHGHLDHVGRIPKLVKDGFRGTILSTPPTRDIGELIMLDSLKILTKEAKSKNKEPLFEERHVLEALPLWKTVEYHEKFSIETNEGDVVITLYDSGHILGASIVVIEFDSKRVAFTGDLGNTPSPLMRETEVPEEIDYLIMESVYGDRNHESFEERVSLLKGAIKGTIDRNGVLMIPAFSVERAQELLFYCNQMVEKGELSSVPIYLDTPLGINVTKVYKKYEHYFNQEAEALIKSGDDIFSFKGLIQTISADESKAIKESPNPKIIIAGSGMSNGGRILHHEKNYLGNHNNALLLVGYQAVGTLGRLLQEGVKTIEIYGESVHVKARILQIHGFSAHKDSDRLLEWAGKVIEKGRIKRVCTILGEPKSAMYLAQRIKEHFGVKVSAPEVGDVLEIL